MKVAVMQPYFFPYLGYFKLIEQVDVFVFLTNVQYIRRGWVNRNRIRNTEGGTQYLTVPVVKTSRDTQIRDMAISWAVDWHRKQLATLRYVYHCERHPVYQAYADMHMTNLNAFLQKTIKMCCEHLGIQTVFAESTSFEDDPNATQRIVNICKALGATEYVNPSGGRQLYSQDDFGDITLSFMEPSSGLSILDNIFRENPMKFIERKCG